MCRSFWTCPNRRPARLPERAPRRGQAARIVAAAVAAGAAGGAAADVPAERKSPRGNVRPAESRRAAGRAKSCRRAENRTDRAESRADTRGDVAANRPERIENRQEVQQNRSERRDEIRNEINDHPIQDFWSENPGWAAMRITRPYRWATWGAVTGWVGSGWTEPTSYSYGDSVYYEGDSVYQGDQVVASAEEYTQQAEEIAASAPEVAPDKAEWLTLGVFAVTPDGQASGPDPSLFLQLAISKEGIISGTLRNTATESTQTVEGMADKASQRAAWTVAGKTRPIMETGISSLTEDTVPALVHFADGQTQQWLLVRLEEPESK